MNGIWQGGIFVLQSTIEERLARVTAERDRLREALADISAEGRHARSGSTAYRMAVIARAALQEE